MSTRFIFLLFSTLVSVSAFITMSVSAQIVTDGLISYWTFDDADISGKTVKDVVGNNHGTMMGDTKVVEGKIGQALEFDGGGDYVNCGDDDSLQATTGLTMGAWVSISNFPNWSNTIISKWDDDADQRGYMFNFGEEMEAAAEDNEVAVIFTQSGTWDIHCQWGTRMALDKDQWYHITITHDSTLAAGNVKAYLNGEFQNEKDWEFEIFPSTANLVIGGYDGPGNGLNAGGNSRWCTGKIDTPFVYNRALSAAEVKQNFESSGMAVNAAGKLALTWGEIKVSTW